MRSALALITADGPLIDLLSFVSLPDIIGTSEFCEVEQRLAES
jgi:hypothetical protein